MRTAHLIHGYLGAGKTTFAKTLEKEAIAIRFTQGAVAGVVGIGLA
jgi:predicted kinase